jgi:hypothetical protein
MWRRLLPVLVGWVEQAVLLGEPFDRHAVIDSVAG